MYDVVIHNLHFFGNLAFRYRVYYYYRLTNPRA
jgi:hypothetical protein